MDNRRALTKVVITSAISDILTWIQTDGRHQVETHRPFKRKDMNHFWIIVDELDGLRGTGNINHHFQIAAIGNPDRYPIDIVEVVWREKDSMRRGGVYLRFRGGEIPIYLAPALIVLDIPGIRSIIDLIVDSNQALIDLIEKSGGKYAVKRPRK